MSTTNTAPKLEPRFQERGPIRFAGMGRIFTFDQIGEIPLLWNQFGQRFGRVPGQVGMISYGVCYASPSGEPGFGYLAAVEVTKDTELPDDLMVLDAPAHRYAVFTHAGHVSQLTETISAIQDEWIPGAPQQPIAPGPGAMIFFERYAEDFNPQTGQGGMEVWQPIQQ